MEAAFKIMSRVPNLEILIFRISLGGEDRERREDELSFKLEKLKHMEVELTSMYDIWVIEYLKPIMNLDTIFFKFGPEIGNYFTLVKYLLPQVIGFISGIPWVRLNLSDDTAIPSPIELFNALTVKELKVWEVEFVIPSPNPIGNAEFFHPIEAFIAHNSGSLENLTLRDVSDGQGRGIIAVPIQVPVLPSLKQLKFLCTQLSASSSFLKPFETNQFPILRKVTVRTIAGDGGLFSVFETTQFDSVDELTIDNSMDNSNPMRTDWSKIFPNLLKLSVLHATTNTIQYVFSKMDKLEYLSLSVFKDPKTIISAYPPLIDQVEGKELQATSQNQPRTFRSMTGNPH